jgi:hypothetical protein
MFHRQPHASGGANALHVKTLLAEEAVEKPRHLTVVIHDKYPFGHLRCILAQILATSGQ